jgi:quinol-cytochrome oxidoreductase complex cytochrome b subunit
MSRPANTEKFDNRFIQWVDERLPIFTMLIKEYRVFPMPKNCNYLWSFGGIAMTMLMIMILTGVFLAMSYTPHTTMAFESVERIMRDVNYGWLLRYVHMNGASFFFVAVYIHIFRGLWYGSYRAPRELLWIIGVVILLLMMATAFMGYALPWSQMSGWGTTVITNLFSAFPLVGEGLVTWLWGGFAVDNPTLNRFFALHYLLPFVILGVVFIHVWALHMTGSNNPAGVEPKNSKDTVPFHPYFSTKDSFALVVFLTIFLIFVFFAPLALTEHDHFKQFDPMQTPDHIVPEWYFLPFYAILRSFTIDIGIPGTHMVLLAAKLQGVLAMFGSILLLLFLPWIDAGPAKSARYRPVYRWLLVLFVISFVALGYAGSQKPEGIPVRIGQLATFYYFLHFALLWRISRNEKTLPVPASISDDPCWKH